MGFIKTIFRELQHLREREAALRQENRELSRLHRAQAEEFDSGQRKVTGRVAGKEVDVSQAYANEYRHKAGNLEAVLQAFERLHAEELAGLSR